MSENPGASEWAAARGDLWRDQLSGMEGMMAAVDDPLISALALDAPHRIADIGCGGGGTSLTILRRAPAGSVVHGFDVSPALIAAASTRTQAIQFKLANVETAAPPAQLYSRLVSRFGIMFFDNPSAAFANLARWLAPHGRFAFATWGSTTENPILTSVRRVAAEIIDVPRPDLEAPNPFRYAEADKLLALLEQAGFRQLAVNDWRGTMPVGGGLPPAEAAAFAITTFSTVADLIAKADEATATAVRRAIAAHFAENVNAEGLVYLPACVHIFTGGALT